MAVGAAPQLELESLFVRIYMRGATQFYNTADAVTKRIDRLNSAFTSMQTTAAAAGTALTSVATSLTSIVSSFTSITPALASLRSLNLAVGRLARLDINAIRANMTGLSSVFSAFTPQSMAGAAALAQTANNLRTALASLSKLGKVNVGIGAMPPVAANINAVSKAATVAASGPLTSLTWQMKDMFRGAFAAANGFRFLRLSIAGLVGLGTAVFTQFDDALTRTLAHMQDWGQTARPLFERAILNISGSSITGAGDLARGLDAMAVSGLTAAQKVEALRIAETFAVASGMQMEEATRKLVDIQNTLGMASENTAQHMANMTRLSDLFVGIAPMVGSSVKQFTEAFGDRFVTAMRQANLSLEQGIILQGIYSFRGIRGSEASDRASRALMELTRRNVENYVRWQMLDIEVFKVGGAMRPMVDIIHDLDAKLGHLNPMQQVATLTLMGFERRAISALMPLIGMSDAFRELEKEIAKVGGVSVLTAEMMRRDFLGQLKILWNNVSNVARAIGEHLAPVLSVLAGYLGTLTQAFTALEPHVQKFLIFGAVGYLAFATVLKTIGPVIGLLASPLIAAYKAVTGLANGIWWTVKGVVSLIGWPLRTMVSLLVSAGGAVKTVYSWLSGMTSFLGSILSSVVSIVASFFLWSFLLAGIVTLFLGLGTFITAIGTAGAAIWTGMIGAAKGFFDWVETNWDVLADTATSAGGTIRKAFTGWFEDLKTFISNAAGFFYNFEENINIITDYLRKNWKQLLDDIGRMGSIAIVNLMNNIRAFGAMIFEIGGIAWDYLWGNAARLARIAFTWISLNWDALVANMGEVFGTFGSNVFHNWKILMTALRDSLHGVLIVPLLNWLDDVKIALYTTMRFIASINPMSPPGMVQRIDAAVGELFAAQRTRNRAREAAINLEGMRSPLEGMGAMTPMRSMAEVMDHIMQSRTPGVLGGVSMFPPALIDTMTKIGATISDTFTEYMSPLLDGFKSMLPPLLLNLAHPPDLIGQAIDKIRNLFRPFHEPEEDMGALGGKQGPGFQFKQISLARTMIGGAALQGLDFQQLLVLRQINNNLEVMIGLQRGQQPSPFPAGMVPILGQ